MENETIRTGQEPGAEQKKGISASVLKVIAVISMLIDHMTAGLMYEGYWRTGHPVTPFTKRLYYVLRGIGRIAFPIYCFLIVEGYYHTRNKWKYLLRLLVFGLISEIPFDLGLKSRLFDMGYQNVYFTLALGLLAIILFDRIVENDYITAPLLRKIGGIAVVAACCGVAELMKTDYSWRGVLMIFLFYLFRNMEILRDLSVGALLAVISDLELAAIIDFIPLHFYNGKRGKQNKYFFYIFYPAHLMLAALLRYGIYGILIR